MRYRGVNFRSFRKIRFVNSCSPTARKFRKTRHVSGIFFLALSANSFRLFSEVPSHLPKRQLTPVRKRLRGFRRIVRRARSRNSCSPHQFPNSDRKVDRSASANGSSGVRVRACGISICITTSSYLYEFKITPPEASLYT